MSIHFIRTVCMALVLLRIVSAGRKIILKRPVNNTTNNITTKNHAQTALLVDSEISDHHNNTNHSYYKQYLHQGNKNEVHGQEEDLIIDKEQKEGNLYVEDHYDKPQHLAVAIDPHGNNKHVSHYMTRPSYHHGKPLGDHGSGGPMYAVVTESTPHIHYYYVDPQRSPLVSSPAIVASGIPYGNRQRRREQPVNHSAVSLLGLLALMGMIQHVMSELDALVISSTSSNTNINDFENSNGNGMSINGNGGRPLPLPRPRPPRPILQPMPKPNGGGGGDSSNGSVATPKPSGRSPKAKT